MRSHRLRFVRVRVPVVAVVDDADDHLGQVTAFVPPGPQRLTDQDILAAVGRIPAQYQDVFVLGDVEELTFKQTAVD